MQRQQSAEGVRQGRVWPALFAGLFGALLGLSLLKFGNPPVTEKWVTPPARLEELLFSYPWPIGWAYGLLVLVAVVGIAVARWRSPAPAWLVALPFGWLAWQCLSATQSADAALSRFTLSHFAACVGCFYLGFFCLSRVQRHWPFWMGLIGGFLLVLAVGWEQHFGGLEASRRYFYLYVYPQIKEVPPEYLKKINSSRIFATLFYPNTLAGALLLLLPISLTGLWQLRAFLTPAAQCLLRFLVGLVGVAALACLYWSGSKGGWLFMLALGMVWVLRLPFGQRLKIILIVAVLVAGLAGFFWRYAGFFQRGATSVSARFDYWQAAIQTARSHPLLGTGPGTFAIPYQQIKRPESEMARLTHNDFLQQASDSGLVGFVAYTLFIFAALAFSYPRSGDPGAADSDRWWGFAAWLGVLGWSLQSLVEFGLYIPALAWPAFTFFGWLLGTRQSPSPLRVPGSPAKR